MKNVRIPLLRLPPLTRLLTTLLLLTTPLLIVLALLCVSPLWASTSSSSPGTKSKLISGAVLGESLLSAMNPRCELELTRSEFSLGETVLASWRILNPAPTRVSVEIKIWFTAPGEAPYSISNALAEGGLVALPASLDEATGMTELFQVDAKTTRGSYEISCRLIDPVTGTMYSEDLNDFQVR